MATTQSGTSGSSTTRGSGSGTQGGMGRGGRQGAPDNATYDAVKGSGDVACDSVYGSYKDKCP